MCDDFCESVAGRMNVHMYQNNHEAKDVGVVRETPK